MLRTLKTKRGVIIAFLLGLALATATTATAATMITSKQIKNGTIRMKDLSPKVRSKIDAPGPVGPAGPVGQPGQTGPAGQPGTFTTDNISIVVGNQTTFPIPFLGGNVPQSNAQCPEGKVAIGGWYEMVGAYFAEPVPFVTSYRQSGNPRMWSVSISWPNTYPPGNNPTYVAKAVCAG